MIKTMFDTAIDAVQSSKKMFVDTFVKHEGLANSLKEFVNIQTEYSKKAVEATLSTGSTVYKTVTEKEFYADLLKSFQNASKSSLHTQEKVK